MPDEIYSSAFLIYTSNLTGLPVRLSKWKSSKRYQNKFADRWKLLQELPFFTYILTAKGEQIYKLKTNYIHDLGLQNVIKTVERNSEKFDIYQISKDDKPFSFELREKISLGALHVAHFIIDAFFKFKKFCEENGLNFLYDPFQIHHDHFPSNHPDMISIVSNLIGMSQYHGYPTRVMSLAHWETGFEMPDSLIADNLAGLFHRVATNKYNANNLEKILSCNETILHWEDL